MEKGSDLWDLPVVPFLILAEDWFVRRFSEKQRAKGKGGGKGGATFALVLSCYALILIGI